MLYKQKIKRVLDVAFSIMGLGVGFLPMVIVACAVKLSSDGPVFFRQRRFGKNSKTFVMYKFRTMATGTPELANQEFSNMGDYITPIGAFLRKTSLDELPQLWNVLKGDMSFVGPRPLADTDMEVIELRKKNGGDTVRPGITGLAQVNGRNKLTNQSKAMYDSEYATNLSFNMELQIVLKTLRAVFVREGINHSEN